MGKTINFELDTGSVRTIIPYSIFSDLFPKEKFRKSSANLRSYDQNEIKVIGGVDVDVECPAHMTKFGVMTSKRLRVTVVDVEGQNICLLGINCI